MKPGALKTKSPRECARSAMELLGCSITWDERDGQAEDDDTVRMGLDAMASALIDWMGLELAAAPLDEVMAELGEEDDLVETAAQLIRILGRSTYDGLGEDGVERAEALREQLVDGLDDLLGRLQG